jgi:hypothetical protein
LRPRAAAVPIDFPQQFNAAQQRLGAGLSLKREFQKGWQVPAQPAITGTQFVLIASLFEPFELMAVRQSFAQTGLADLFIT